MLSIFLNVWLCSLCVYVVKNYILSILNKLYPTNYELKTILIAFFFALCVAVGFGDAGKSFCGGGSPPNGSDLFRRGYAHSARYFCFRTQSK